MEERKRIILVHGGEANGGGVKVGWDRIVKGKKFVHRHIGVIFFRKIILKGMGKMAGKGKERHIYVYLDGRWGAVDIIFSF